MRMDVRDCEIYLEGSQLLRLDDASGLRVACTAGTVWLTACGETADVFLRSGQSYRLHSAGLVLIEAVGRARVRLEDGAASRSR